MKHGRQSRFPRFAGILFLAALLTVACASVETGAEQNAARPDLEDHGAALWAANCTRCHNLRPAASYNDAEWAVIVHHMRQRAGLTGEEQREITAFLQRAN